VSCHADVHQGELGTNCATCHSPSTFHLTTFTHPRFAAFFTGAHGTVLCAKCHTPAAPRPAAGGARTIPARYKNIPTTCATCHQDTHLGQFGSNCESCHSLAAGKFTVTSFSHETTSFPLTGRHGTVACAQCHKRETGTFPAGQGTAMRFKGVQPRCQACHSDVHLGQFTAACETCHTTAAFKMPGYKHRTNPERGFFAGRHARLACTACHEPRNGAFPGGTGTAVLYRVDPACTTCHTDIHRGSLGTNCIECHRP
jgi:hypothetical protein